MGKNLKGERKYFTNPYKDDNWTIVNKYSIENATFTERKMEGYGVIVENLNVRDKPGLKSSTVIDIIKPNGNQFSEKFVSITEEKDFIGGKNDYWLKINYKGNKYGWVFGGYVDVLRGGYKYDIPSNIIRRLLDN